MAAVETKQHVRAQAKWVHMSARKARLVTDHIRGRSVPEARTVLAFTQRAAAREIEKVLRSAVANAEANHGLVGDHLFVSSAMVDEGPTLKRFRARARGRAGRIHKRTCHITLTLAPLDGAAVQAPRRAPVPPPPPAPEPVVEVTAAVVEETPAVEEPAAEEKPKRGRAKKAEEPQAEEKPKRSRARKPEEPKAEKPKPEKPKRSIRRKKES